MAPELCALKPAAEPTSLPGKCFFVCHFLGCVAVAITLCGSEMVATGTSQPSHYLLRLLIILNPETEPPALQKTVMAPATLTCVHPARNALLYVLSSLVSLQTGLVNEIHLGEPAVG